jgi:hypothetical protein
MESRYESQEGVPFYCTRLRQTTNATSFLGFVPEPPFFVSGISILGRKPQTTYAAAFCTLSSLPYLNHVVGGPINRCVQHEVKSPLHVTENVFSREARRDFVHESKFDSSNRYQWSPLLQPHPKRTVSEY